MIKECLDTNVIIRYLVETPGSIDRKFKGVFSFFEKLENDEIKVFLPDLVLFQAYFVLTSYYSVPSSEAASKLRDIISLRGIIVVSREILSDCLRLLMEEKITDIVDAYLLAYSRVHKISGIYSFDAGFQKHGMKLLDIS